MALPRRVKDHSPEQIMQVIAFLARKPIKELRLHQRLYLAQVKLCRPDQTEEVDDLQLRWCLVTEAIDRKHFQGKGPFDVVDLASLQHKWHCCVGVNRMQWYESLNDVADRYDYPEFRHGNVMIWFGCQSQLVTSQTLFRAASLGWMPDPNDLPRTHGLLGCIEAKDCSPEDIFAMMQQQYWCPRGEAAMLLRQSMVDHASMTIGDVIQIRQSALSWICRPEGFEQIPYVA